MTDEHVITMCMWRRPKYSLHVLSRLLQCHGIEKYTVVVHLDGPENPDVTAILRAHRGAFKNLVVVQNKDHIGCNENTKRALAHGMVISDYVIHIEDDVVPAHDALRLLEWARDVPKKEPVYSATMWRHPDGWLPEKGGEPTQGMEGVCKYSTGMWIWGWATWREKWNKMSACWTTGDDRSASWDDWLCAHLPKPILNIAPMISRSNNIGAELGTHTGSALLDYWALSPGVVEPNEYKLI